MTFSPTVVSVGLAIIVVLSGLALVALKIRARFRRLDRQLDALVARIDEKALETQHALALQQLGFRVPVFYGDWSIDPFLGKFILQHLIENQTRSILELGSGSSTVLIARCLRALGRSDCLHIAVDHDSRFLELTRRNLRLNDLAEGVELWYCPLAPVAGSDKVWYGGLKEKLRDKSIDLLIVDGPPGALQPESRFPALPTLLPFLSEVCVVILDDASRADERSVARKWAAAYPRFSLEFLLEGHGLAVLRKQPGSVTDAAQVAHAEDRAPLRGQSDAHSLR